VAPPPSPAAGTASAAPAPPAAARPGDTPAELRELAAAFARGAGLGAEVAPLTPAWMEHLGALLRATAEGTLALLRSRALTKRQMRAEGTHITPRQNNPLKFSPDATEALTRMLQREASPGFLDPVEALRDAHRDLLVHQVAMVAGMRAAVFELFSRLGPEAAESGEGPAHGLSRLPVLRAAALWQRHRMQHAQLLEHLDDDFQTIFGREFLRAYEAQSRADAGADPPSPEAPWPNGH
jgi:type VI secretion system FHA domain protein